MKHLIYLLAGALTFSQNSTARENYTVETMPNPPSLHGSKQIDGLDFLPDGRLVVCLPSGEIFFYDV